MAHKSGGRPVVRFAPEGQCYLSSQHGNTVISNYQVSSNVFLLLITGTPQRGYLSLTPDCLQGDHSPLGPECNHVLASHQALRCSHSTLVPRIDDLENSAVSGCIAQTPVSTSSPSNSLLYLPLNISAVWTGTYVCDRYRLAPRRFQHPCIHKVCVGYGRFPYGVFHKSPSYDISVSKQHDTCIPILYALIYYCSLLNSFPTFSVQKKLGATKLGLQFFFILW